MSTTGWVIPGIIAVIAMLAIGIRNSLVTMGKPGR
jgi:hypothetical protein